MLRLSVGEAALLINKFLLTNILLSELMAEVRLLVNGVTILTVFFLTDILFSEPVTEEPKIELHLGVNPVTRFYFEFYSVMLI